MVYNVWVKKNIFGLVLVACCLVLSGCNPLAQPSPEEIMTQVENGLTNLTSVNFDAELRINGPVDTSLLPSTKEATIALVGELRNSPVGLPEYSVMANVSARSQVADIRIEGQVISLHDFTYFQLTQLSLPALLSSTINTDRKWYRIPTETTLANRADITKSTISEASPSSIHDLILSTQPLTVIEVLPVATINGQRAYHYKTAIDPSQLTDFLEGLNQLSGGQFSLPSLKHLDQYQPEIFVSTKDRSLLGIRVLGEYLKDGQPVGFNLNITFSRHNKGDEIMPPRSSENIESGKLFYLPKLPF